MRTTLLSILLFAAAAATAAPSQAADSGFRSQSARLPVEGATLLEIDRPVGQLLLDGGDGTDVDATMSVRCTKDRCRDQVDKVALATERVDGRLKIKVEGLTRATASGFEVKLLVDAPGSLATEIDLAVGEVRVRGMTSNLEIDTGVGDIEVEMPRAAVKQVTLDAGVGEARLRTDLGEIQGSGMVGSGLKWSQGTGTAVVEIDTGVGQISVDLR